MKSNFLILVVVLLVSKVYAALGASCAVDTAACNTTLGECCGFASKDENVTDNVAAVL